MGLYTALALANSEHQMVANGLIFALPKIPAKFVTKYGVHAMNHSVMVINAILANLHSALVCAASDDLKEATFIFLA